MEGEDEDPWLSAKIWLDANIDVQVEKCIYTGPFSDVFVIAECAAPTRKYAMKVERVVGVQRYDTRRDSTHSTPPFLWFFVKLTLRGQA